MTLPFVSIIVPCRNEEKFIARCLDSIVANEYPIDRMEVMVIDGMSCDRTREIVSRYAGWYPFIALLNNESKIVPNALNIGIRNARGEIIMRMDAHSLYKKGYVAKCVSYLQSSNADNVGGICIAVPGSDNLRSRAIAIALSHRFGVGNAYFRTGTKEPKYVDTVPFGCYKRDVFERFGLFDEDFVRNQDDEFNHRIKKHGGKILLVPDIVSYYFVRDSIPKLWKMYFQYGYFKPLIARKLGRLLTFRQLVPAMYVGGICILLALSPFIPAMALLLSLIAASYAGANLAVSLALALRKDFRYLFILPAVFATIHYSYGLGYLKGIFDFVIRRKTGRGMINDLPITR